MFLLPGLVIGSYVSGMGFKLEERQEMIRYLMNRANPDDGGWGMWVGFTPPIAQTHSSSSHVEGHSTVFGTGLNYTALRLLGMDADHPVCVKARGTLHRLGKIYPASPFPLLTSCKVEQLLFQLGVNFGFRCSMFTTGRVRTLISVKFHLC
jgi:hypothetical protein